MEEIEVLKSLKNKLTGTLMRYNGLKIDIKELIQKIKELDCLTDKEFDKEITFKDYFLENMKKTHKELDELILDTKKADQMLLSAIIFDESERIVEILDKINFLQVYYDFREIYKNISECIDTFTQYNKSDFQTIVFANFGFLKKLERCVNANINAITQTITYIKEIPDENLPQK